MEGENVFWTSWIRNCHANIKKIHKCDSCEMTFKLKRHLIQHVAAVHENKKDYKCSMCSRAFSLKTNLKQHIRTIHENKKEFNCNNCQKSFQCKAELELQVYSWRYKKWQVWILRQNIFPFEKPEKACYYDSW